MIEKETPTITPKPHQQSTFEPQEKRTQADKRINYLLKKHFEDDPEFRPVISKLAEYDPTPNKKYLGWLVKHWCGNWNPDDVQLQRVSQCLRIHNRGAKYFSPLTWTGLELEAVGYQADVFRFTPQSILWMQGRIAEIIQTDEENKQIRKGNLVATAGAEIAYQDEKWTLLRVRTQAALKRLGQGCGWCVCGNRKHGYRFPFDFLLTIDGERYLANRTEIADRWNVTPPHNVCEEINIIRALSSDSYDRAADLVNSAIQKQKRQNEENEKEILKYPEEAIRYAEAVLGGAWPEFEKKFRVADLSAHLAVEYAIRCRKEPWPKFENKIKRSIDPLARYRRAFPTSIPKNEKEIFQDKLAMWRRVSGNLKRPWKRWSLQGQVESRQRSVDFEVQLLQSYAEASVKRYARLVASLSTSSLADEYRERLLSYFTGAADEKTIGVNEQLAPLICKHIHCRVPELEEYIQRDSRLSLAYALGIGERFEAGEESIRKDPEAWWKYSRKFMYRQSAVQSAEDVPRRCYLPANIRTAWM